MCSGLCRIEVRFNSQSAYNTSAVDAGAELGAGDQGMMFSSSPGTSPMPWQKRGRAAPLPASGAYRSRQVAKTIVAARLASRCTVQLSYAIGRSSPVSVSVDTHGTGLLGDHLLALAAGEFFDLSPGGNIRDLGLDRPVFLETTRRGHFGRAGYAWEGYGKVEELRAWAESKAGQTAGMVGEAAGTR